MNIIEWLRWKFGGSKYVNVELFGQNRRVRAVKKSGTLTTVEPVTFTSPSSMTITHVTVHDKDGVSHNIPLEGNDQ